MSYLRLLISQMKVRKPPFTGALFILSILIASFSCNNCGNCKCLKLWQKLKQTDEIYNCLIKTAVSRVII